MKLKAIVERMLTMCPQAWYIFIRTLQLCVFLLFCAFVLLVERQNNPGNGYTLYMTAISLNETVQALLLISILSSAIIDDAHS